MKRKLSFLKVLCAFIMLTFSAKGIAQINYSQNFNGEEIDWYDPNYDFFTDDEFGCDGTSIVANIYYDYDYEMSAYSDVIGISNGQPATLSYTYKLVDYSTGEAYPNSPDWGSFTVQYATSVNGPWTDIETVSAANHTVSAACAVRTVEFTPTGGAAIYLRVTAQVNSASEIDALIYFDDVQVEQDPSPACAGTPDASVPVASSTVSCHGGDVTLSLDPVYLVSGLTFQWQSSSNGTDYVDLEAATEATYTTAITESMWFRAIVTCVASDESVTTTGLQITDSGLPCYCDVDFYEGVEPITHVTFAGIDNASTADPEAPSLEVFTALAPAEVTAGQTYTITLEGNTLGDFADYFTVFIDFNKNGDFNDEGEIFEIEGSLQDSTGEDGQQVTAQIEIPATVEAGITVMRVSKSFLYAVEDACDYGIGYGQAEDYRVNITVIDCNLAAPVAAGEQSFCGDAEVGELTATATGNAQILWYFSADATEPLIAETEVVNGNTYYVSQAEGECESARVPVFVTINVTPEPTGDDEQEFTINSTEGLPISEVEVTVTEGATLLWYATEEDAENNTNPLPEGYVITESGEFYAVQVIDGCYSDVFDVEVTLTTLGVNGFDNNGFTCYPNPATDVLNFAGAQNISNVAVHNLLGQKVTEFSNLNATTARVDISSLPVGTYLVKATAQNGATATFKVIKK